MLGEVGYRPTLDMDDVVMEKDDINLRISVNKTKSV